MEADYNVETLKQCYKIRTHIFDRLNILYNASNAMFVLWNKYQILVYENLNFEETAYILVPEFITQQTFVSSNYLMCLDNNGSIFVTSFKFKNPAQKRFKSTFQLRDSGVAAVAQADEEHMFCLKYNNTTLNLNLHKISGDFLIVKEAHLNYDFIIPPRVGKLQGTCLLRSFEISKQDEPAIKLFFDTEKHISDLVTVSLDSMAVYVCAFARNSLHDKVITKKLYDSPAEISNIEILNNDTIQVIIALKIGTIIKLSLENKFEIARITHLNASIHRIISFKDTLLYTDGKALWRCNINEPREEIDFKKFFVKLPRDFIKFGDQIMCVTNSKHLYMFPLDDESVYIKALKETDFISADILLNKSEHYDDIKEEVCIGYNLAQQAKVETNYLALLALCNRPDVVNTAISYKSLIYDLYEDVGKETKDLHLTNEISEYFVPETFLVLVRVMFLERHKINSLLGQLFPKLKLHITLETRNVMMKTVSVAIGDVRKDLEILIPLENKDINQLTTKIKLIPIMPGVYNEKENSWLILSKNEMVLNSEQFIKCNESVKTVNCLVNSKTTLDEDIREIAEQMHGNLFCIETIKQNNSLKEWTYYIKLPDDYMARFSNKTVFSKYLNSTKTEYIYRNLSCKDFLQAKKRVNFKIGSNYVNLQIIEEDLSSHTLRIASNDIMIGKDIRSFISNVIFELYEDYGPAKLFVPQAHYTIVESLQRSIKSCIMEQKIDFQTIYKVIEQYQKNVMGALPL